MSERRNRKRILPVLVIVGAVVIVFLNVFAPNRPVDYANIQDHFKYGSIGSEIVNGIPAAILKVLPVVFRDKLPGEGLASLGFVQEPGQEFPAGFSKRRVFIDRVWLNCGVCHTGTVRATPGGPRQIYAGMPANTMNLQSLIRFLVSAASDERFTPEGLMPEIERSADLNFLERLLYRYRVISLTREGLVEVGRKVEFMTRQPDWGPGRVDTFNPYKAVQFNFPMEKIPDSEIVGTTDLPSIWLQQNRQGMKLHWDGNNISVEERNKSAALGAGVTPVTIDLPRIKRIEDWLLDLTPPPDPFPIDEALAETGGRVYTSLCADCHGRSGRDFGGARVGEVVPVAVIGTDRHRLDSFTDALAANQNTLFAGYPWRFKEFRKTNGYSNMPLDGLWLRAPYLHNGSVPSLLDLLEPPEQRPKVFYRGYDVYDPERVGFFSDVAEESGRPYFRYDTSLPGNGNEGHVYGVTLDAGEKEALVEYLKTF